jgi:hypothetical protein
MIVAIIVRFFHMTMVTSLLLLVIAVVVSALSVCDEPRGTKKTASR